MSDKRKKERTRNLDYFLQSASKGLPVPYQKSLMLVNPISLSSVQKIPDPIIRFKALSSCYPQDMPEDIVLLVDCELERIRRDSLKE